MNREPTLLNQNPLLHKLLTRAKVPTPSADAYDLQELARLDHQYEIEEHIAYLCSDHNAHVADWRDREFLHNFGIGV